MKINKIYRNLKTVFDNYQLKTNEYTSLNEPENHFLFSYSLYVMHIHDEI